MATTPSAVRYGLVVVASWSALASAVPSSLWDDDGVLRGGGDGLGAAGRGCWPTRRRRSCAQVSFTELIRGINRGRQIKVQIQMSIASRLRSFGVGRRSINSFDVGHDSDATHVPDPRWRSHHPRVWADNIRTARWLTRRHHRNGKVGVAHNRPSIRRRCRRRGRGPS